MSAEPRLRRWARSAVIVVATLASIATSPAKWSLSAPLPPGAPSGAKGTVVTIEGSQEPSIARRRIGGSRQIEMRPEDPPWSGRAAYYLPPGFELARASISDRCTSGGGLCSGCDPPPTAFVRVAGLDAVAPWSLGASSPEQTARVAEAGKQALFTVEIEASRRVEVEVLPTGGDAASFESPWTLEEHTTSSKRQFTVGWSPKGSLLQAPIEVRWVVRATIEGFCRGEGECRPPETEHVRIEGVTPK